MLGVDRLRVGTFTRHLMARRHKRGRARRMIVAGLMLTSMVDMFSLLVIFLLQSFSSSPETMVLKNITLPPAMTGLPVQDAPVLAIGEEMVVFEQKPMGSKAEVLSHPESLLQALSELKTRWAQQHPGEPFRGDVQVQADTNLSAAQVSQFMNILIAQGYGSVQLAVVGGKAE